MSQRNDEALVKTEYPAAWCKAKVSTGGSKVKSFTIHSGTGDNLPVGPTAFTEGKAWHYAAERLELNVKND